MSRLTSLTNKLARRLAGSGGYLVCAAGFVLTLIAFYPGLMSPDSIDQWTQGHAWSFYDVHPPLMSALWGVFDRVVAGPALMLVFHNLLFWGGAALLWRLKRAESARMALGFAAFGFLPQVWAFLPVVWKDVGLGASFLAASALVYAAERRASRAALLLSVPLLFYGYGVRLNAAPAALPLALWSGVVACRVFARLRGLAARRRVFVPVACGLVYFVLLTFAVSVVTKALVGGRTLYPYQQILLYDLAGISKETGRSEFPEYVSAGEGFSIEKVSEAYTPGGVNPLIYGAPPPLKITTDAGQIAALRAKWWAAVSSHKLLYLEQRWALFAQLNGINTQGVPMAFYPATGLNNPPQFRRPLNALTRALTDYFFYFSRSVLFRGFFWILLSAALAYLSLRLRLEGDLEASFALASSGLLYALGYFFYTPSPEFRYLWWTVLAAAVSSILFAAHLVANWRRLRAADRERASA